MLAYNSIIKLHFLTSLYHIEHRHSCDGEYLKISGVFFLRMYFFFRRSKKNLEGIIHLVIYISFSRDMAYIQSTVGFSTQMHNFIYVIKEEKCWAEYEPEHRRSSLYPFPFSISYFSLHYWSNADFPLHIPNRRVFV